MPHTASQPNFSWRATAVTAASRSQSIASRSNSRVNFESGVAPEPRSAPRRGSGTRRVASARGSEFGAGRCRDAATPARDGRRSGTPFGTPGTCQRALGADRPDVHGLARDIDFHPLHRPRRGHPQDRRVRLLPVPHRPRPSFGHPGRRDDTSGTSEDEGRYRHPPGGLLGWRYSDRLLIWRGRRGWWGPSANGSPRTSRACSTTVRCTTRWREPSTRSGTGGREDRGGAPG